MTRIRTLGLAQLLRPLLTSIFALCLLFQSHDAPAAPVLRAGHLVLAHYMVCCGRFGHEATMAQYKQEIEEARSLGIDGFVLDIGAWFAEPYYQQVTKLLFYAAKAAGGDFKLLFCLDELPVDNSVDAISTYYQHPNYLRLNERAVVTTYGGTRAWGVELTKRLKEKGIGIVFVPGYFYGHRDVMAHLDPRGMDVYDADLALRENPEMDGYFYFGAGGTWEELTPAMRQIVRLTKDARKISMLGIAPYYKGFGPKNSRVFESDGFTGMRAQWLAAIQSHADWVELVTWNDWGEATYVSPLGASSAAIWNGHWGRLLAHEKFLEASRHYIDWFKTGREPPISRNELYYFYRVHPKTAAGLTQPTIDQTTRGRPSGWEKLDDEIFFTAFLKEPLRVTIKDGPKSYAWDLQKGISMRSIPMALGPLSVAIDRDGQEIAEKKLEFDITDDGTRGSFNYFGGSVPIP